MRISDWSSDVCSSDLSAILFARSIGDPASVEQRAELRLSRAALDAITPNGANDLEAAFAADRPLIAEARDGRTTDAIRAMRLAADMRGDPTLRASEFVQRWRKTGRSSCRESGCPYVLI